MTRERIAELISIYTPTVIASLRAKPAGRIDLLRGLALSVDAFLSGVEQGAAAAGTNTSEAQKSYEGYQAARAAASRSAPLDVEKVRILAADLASVFELQDFEMLVAAFHGRPRVLLALHDFLQALSVPVRDVPVDTPPPPSPVSQPPVTAPDGPQARAKSRARKRPSRP